MKYRYTVTANSSKPEIYHDGNLLVFAKARCDYEYIPKDEEAISEQTLPLTCWQKAIRIGNILLDTSPYWVSILYALVCLYSAFVDPGKYIVTVAFLFYSLFELVLEIFEQKLELYGIKRQITILLLLFIALVFGIFVVPAYLQIAAYYGRFCGAKRPQCEAERPGFLLI